MADFDSKLPIRSLAADNTTEIADSTGTTINPAKEDGHLATIDTTLAEIATDTDKLDVNLSTRVAEATFTARINTLGQKTMANSTPVVIASDQSAIPVTFTPPSGVNAFRYNTSSALAASASSTHSYSPSSAEKIDQIVVTASGQLKIEVQFGTTGSEATIFVGFTSKGSLNFIVPFPDTLDIATTQTIKIIRTNLDNQAMDVYSSIFVHA